MTQQARMVDDEGEYLYVSKKGGRFDGIGEVGAVRK